MNLPSDGIERRELEHVVDLVLTWGFSPLAGKEIRALRLRFGIDDGRERTYREIGTEMGRTSQTAFNYVNRALRKLRYSARVRGLLSLVWR